MDSKITILLAILLSWSPLVSQDSYGLAKKAFDSGDYNQAVSYLNSIPGIDEDQKAVLLRGKTYFRINDLDRTIRDLTRARKLGYNDPEVYWLMAQTMQHKGIFNEAIYFYKILLTRIDQESTLGIKARAEIKNCAFSIENQSKRKKLLVQGFGDRVNSQANELHVAQSPQFGNLFYYSSDSGGQLQMIAKFLNDEGAWITESNFSKKFGKGDSEWISDISSDGQNIIYYQEQRDKLRPITSSVKNGVDYETIINERSLAGAKDIQLLNSKTCVFASDQLNGYGGYDLYTISYEEGSWSQPINLGSEINSPFDERTPYMSSDLKMMYFSSNKPYCYGGFDVYKATMEGSDVSVRHLNSTINSAGDDLGFRFHNDAQMAFLYSDRKSGKGGYDLYFAYLDEPVRFKWAAKEGLDFIRLDNNQEDKPQIIEEAPLDTLITEVPDSTTTTTDVAVSQTEDPEELEVEATQSKIEEQTAIEEELTFANSLFYNDRTDLLRDENALKLSKLIEFLKDRSDLKVKLIVYADYFERGLAEYLQYNNLKRGLSVAEYLETNGIDPKRIAIESYSNNYPLSKYEVAGNVQTELSKYNRRIDIEILDWQGNIYWAPDTWSFPVPKYARAREYDLFTGIREEVYFSVKIASVDRMYKNAVLRIYQDVYVRKEHLNGTNDYYIGIYTDFESAQELALKLENQPRVDAEVVAFFGGSKINKADINRLEISYPELSHLKE